MLSIQTDTLPRNARG